MNSKLTISFKVREAQARKKFKAAQRLEKLKKKSDLLANEEGMTEKEKAESIAKLIGKAKKKAPKRSVKVVVARGPNRGIQGRPKVSTLESLTIYLKARPACLRTSYSCYDFVSLESSRLSRYITVTNALVLRVSRVAIRLWILE